MGALLSPSLAHADDADDPIFQILSHRASCRSEPDCRKVFSCSDRKVILNKTGIYRSTYPQIFAGISAEHVFVKTAMESVIKAVYLTAFEKAILWEDLTSFIYKKLERPVSESFSGLYAGDAAYVFQGIKRFEGKAYVLVILPNGVVYTGLADPIANIGEWLDHLSSLKQVTGPTDRSARPPPALRCHQALD